MLNQCGTLRNGTAKTNIKQEVRNLNDHIQEKPTGTHFDNLLWTSNNL